MKIDKAIVSSNLNSDYLDFWPLVSKVWKLKLNINSVLLLICDENKEEDSEFGKIIKIKKIDNIPEYLQAQWVRFWYLSTLKDEIGIISDIDMFPISKKYFVDQIENISNDKYVHINPCLDTYPNIPACYHISSGNLFKEIMKISDSFEESLNKLLSFTNIFHCECGDKKFWFLDEKYSTYHLNKWDDRSKLIYLKRDQGQNGFRIDRSNWKYDENLLKQDFYYDAHSIRPYKQHKEEIDKFVNFILSNV